MNRTSIGLVCLTTCSALALIGVSSVAGKPLSKTAMHTNGSSKVVSAPFLVPTITYYGGVKAKNTLMKPGQAALELNTPAHGKNPWDQAVQEKLPVSVPLGDVLLASFMIRDTKPVPNATVVFNAEGPAPGYTKAASQVIHLTAAWKRVSIPFSATLPLPAKTGDFNFFLDTVPQVVQIANFQVIDYGKSKNKATLPHAGY